MIYIMLYSLFQGGGKDDNGETTTGIDNAGEYFFANPGSYSWQQDSESGQSGLTGYGSTSNQLFTLFKEFDAVATNNSYSTALAKTNRRVALLEPYVKSMPITLLRYILVMAGFLNMEGLLARAAGETVSNLTHLIGALLPLPFASMGSNVANPTAEIYIDLSAA